MFTLSKTPPLPSNRKFGLFFSAVFAIVAAYFLWKSTTSWLSVFGILALITLAVTILSPATLLPFNKAWFAFGMLLGKIISPIVLGILFFLVITPVALVMKLARRDELRLQIRDEESHWKQRTPIGPDPESFKNQF